MLASVYLNWRIKLVNFEYFVLFQNFIVSTSQNVTFSHILVHWWLICVSYLFMCPYPMKRCFCFPLTDSANWDHISQVVMRSRITSEYFKWVSLCHKSQSRTPIQSIHINQVFRAQWHNDITYKISLKSCVCKFIQSRIQI